MEGTATLAPLVEPEQDSPAAPAGERENAAEQTGADEPVPVDERPRGQVAAEAVGAEAEVPVADAAKASAEGNSELLKSEAWHLAAGGEPDPLDEPVGTDAVDRWRHEGVAEIMARPVGEWGALQAALLSNEPVVAGNAAIALARLGEPVGPEPLVTLVRASSLKLATRRAAAEALQRVETTGAVEALRQLIDEYGEAAASTGSTPELQAELLTALARRVDAAAEPRLVSALAASSAEVRRAAIRGWCRPGRAGVPREVLDRLTDPDPTVRRWALAALVLREQPEAEGFLKTALNDEQLEVRKGAIAALGRRKSEEAVELLQGLVDHRAELIRAAAVSALGQQGVEAALVEALSDGSWQVRGAAAEGLGRFPSRRTAGRLAALLEDASLDVRRRAVAAVRDWPVAEAAPVLWAGMASASYAVRRESAELLSAGWPAARAFVADAPLERRVEWLGQLREAWSQELDGVVQVSGERAVTASEGEAAPVVPARVEDEQVEAWLRTIEQAQHASEAREALDALARSGTEVVAVLERLVLDEGRVLPESVYQTALPQISEPFARLSELASDNMALARQAVEQLADAVGEAPLGPLARERLVQLVERESDPLVWRGALAALAEDGSETAARLAMAGLSHPDSEVRRRACVRLGRFPRADQARLLVPTLADGHTGVVRAAVAAIAVGGTLAEAEGLEKLLEHPDRTLRVEVAAALCRIGAKTGGAALERLAHDADSDVRRRAAKAMGELGRQEFLPALVALLEDRLSTVRQAAEVSLVQVAGEDVGRRADGGAGPPQRAEQWKRWWRERTAEDVVSGKVAP